MTTRKPRGYWHSKGKCEKAARNCETRTEFRSKFDTAYRISKENGWLEEFFGEGKHERGFWLKKENCQEAAKKCKTRSQFNREYNTAYKNSRSQGWLEEFFPDRENVTKTPTPKRKPLGYWSNPDNVINSAKGFDTYTLWMKNENTAYQSARRLGLTEIVKELYFP